MRNLLFYAAMVFSFQAFAASCPTQAGSCPQYSVCLKWSAPTTREDGTALAASEIANYELSKDATVIASPLGNILSANYGLSPGESLTTSTVFSIVTVDASGLRSSKATACTLASAVTRPKAPPAAPMFQ